MGRDRSRTVGRDLSRLGMMRALTVCVVDLCGDPAVYRGRCELHKRRINRAQWRVLVRKVIRRDAGVCWLCGKQGADTADHVRRWADGGSDELSNLRAAHLRCNQSRRISRRAVPRTGITSHR